MERIILIFAVLSLGHAVNLHHNNPIALKVHGRKEKWLSCWGEAGSDCEFRVCPGLQLDPFVGGGENGYMCRAEIFLIQKQGGGEIKNCDVVALEYDHGWWLSCSRSFNRSRCSTRTCPGDSWGNNWNRCEDEKFRIRVFGKSCGDHINNKDIIALNYDGTDSKAVCYNSGSIYAEPCDVKIVGFSFIYRIFIESVKPS